MLTLVDRLEEAIPLLAASQPVLAARLGPTDERAVQALIDLGDAQRRAGRLEESAVNLRLAVDLSRDSIVVDDDHLANALRMLGVLLSQGGSLVEAEGIQREARERILARFGEQHPQALSSATELANTLQRLDRLEEAELLNRQAVEIGRTVLGERHPDQITALNSLASVLLVRGAVDEALRLRREVIEARLDVLGPDHENTWTARANLAVVLARTGETAEAEHIYRDVLERQRERFGVGDRRVMTTMYNLGTLLRDARRLDEAFSVFQELVRAADEALPPSDWQRAVYRAGRGYCLANAKSFGPAEADLLAAHGDLERLLGPDHSQTRAVRMNLGRLYQKMGRAEEAERWR
jgi:tetratricopeptide (TPR) repeat protein